MKMDAEDDLTCLFDFTVRSAKFDIFMMLERLVGSQRIESHKHLLGWVLKKWRQVSGNYEEPKAVQAKSNAQAPGPIGESTLSITSDPDLEKKRLAAERRKKIMEQMALAQKNFMKENATLFDEGTKEEKKVNKDADIIMDTTEAHNANLSDCNSRPLVALGPQRTAPCVTETTFTCILCQEEDKLQPEGKALVMASFVQKSTVLSNKRNNISDEGFDSSVCRTEGNIPFIWAIKFLIFKNML